MCVVSMVYDWAKKLPEPTWKDPNFLPAFEDLHEQAQKYDEETGQPDCELDEKRQALKKLADELNIKIKFLEAA